MMGYLAAVPSGSKDSRFKYWATSLPDPGPLSYLWDWLTQMGVIIGGCEISYPDIKAWSELTGIELQPQEATSLAELSRIWLNEKLKGADPEAFAPWLPECD